MSAAAVFDLKRFALHDGDGIRTTLFIKGCPLRCAWCQNPEGLSSGIRLWYTRNDCLGCRACERSCGLHAIAWGEEGVRVDRARCNLCGDCVKACPAGALRFDGELVSAQDAIAEIRKDRVFFGRDGGVTLSGGECMQSPDFTLEVLRGCRKLGIGTHIETCLYAPAETVAEIADLCDCVIADIKLMDPVRHKAATGMDNALILENIRMLAKRGTNLLLRTPLIPGYTDDAENIAAIADFVASLGADIPLELLNFNPMFVGKYKALGLECAFGADQKELPRERVNTLRQIVEDHGVRVI